MGCLLVRGIHSDQSKEEKEVYSNMAEGLQKTREGQREDQELRMIAWLYYSRQEEFVSQIPLQEPE